MNSQRLLYSQKAGVKCSWKFSKLDSTNKYYASCIQFIYEIMKYVENGQFCLKHVISNPKNRQQIGFRGHWIKRLNHRIGLIFWSYFFWIKSKKVICIHMIMLQELKIIFCSPFTFFCFKNKMLGEVNRRNPFLSPNNSKFDS